MTKWSKHREGLFLRHLAETGNVSAAARQAGLDRAKVYRKRRSSRAFAQKWQSAIDEALDHLESQLRERALTGTEKPVFYGGKACGTVRNYNDSLAMFLLRAHRPGIYADRGKKGMPDPAAAPSQNQESDARSELVARLERLIQKAETE